MKSRFCFVTEVDLDRQGAGAITNDQQMLQCLREFGDVDLFYLQRARYGSTPLALIIFLFQVLKSFSKNYSVYFSRGLITSFLLVSFNILTLRKRKIVHRALSIPSVSKEVEFLGFGRAESLFRSRLFLFLEHFVYSHVDSLTVAAEVYEQELIAVGVRPDKISVLNFFTGDEFFDLPLKSMSDGVFKFCYIGGFHLYQDLLPVLKALEIFSKTNKDFEFLLIGDGPQRPKLEEEGAKSIVRNKLKFVRKVSHSSLPGFLSQIDCFISLTRKPGLSISVIEAAAAGKAIITHDPRSNVAYNNYFRHKKEIYLVDSISSDEIAEAIELLCSDSTLRDTIARGARRVAQQHFSERVARKQLEKLIHKVS